ncbi:hypothetical protein [Eubacterium sp.]|uniref:sacsin N-terminal ATP-binding-like domain-containing protein n=1 Tax=Eubacterium sp. TaxID=142586 RepID=UPI0025F9C6EB|nr:hypothetical protein [Eubacterium sp.]MCR5629069.1 hypothetical protein [Eubacterium sp.]
MGKINYKAIYDENHNGWYKMTEEPGKYEALLAGHYSDSNHFVYELIQNAEDAKASCVVFEYHGDKVCFYHDGKPFDEADVRGVSSMLETTKAEDSQTIGKFGMGFKSVFKYTCEPEIYSDDEAFRIKNYLLPIEIKDGWDYKYEKNEGLRFNLKGEDYTPFEKSNHLTKVVLPFQKREKDESIHKIDGSDIVKKLKELEPEILLFLSNIKTLLWVDSTKNIYEKIVLIDDEDVCLKICSVIGNAEPHNLKRYEDRYYFKYIKNVNHPKMGNAQVSLAFLTNSQQKSIQKMENTELWVFFPTKDRTNLPCFLHGSFETAVSREKLMRPSEFNAVLFQAAEKLFLEAILDFKNRNLITQSFIRQILLTAFNDYTLPNLKKSVTDLFKNSSLIPTRGDNLAKPENVRVSIPFDLIDLEKNTLFKDSYKIQEEFVLLNDEKAAGFTEYYEWLTEDLNVDCFSFYEWSLIINKMFETINQRANYDLMIDLYDFLYEYRYSDYSKEGKWGRKKSKYEEDVQRTVKKAWPILRESKILINGENNYISSLDKSGNSQVYLSSVSDYFKIAKSAIVLSFLTSNYKSLLEEDFEVKEFDNYEYVKEKVLVKYSHHSRDVELTEEFIEEYAEDILQISHLMIRTSFVQDIQTMIDNRCIIIARDKTGSLKLVQPDYVYMSTSVEGADMRTYFSEIDVEIYFLEEDFYRERGISLECISRLGIHTSPIYDGPQSSQGIKAIGDFKPFLEFGYLRENISYIQEHEKTDLAQKKSACLLKISLDNAKKMIGKVVVGTSENISTKDAKSKVLEQLRKDDWLYTEKGLNFIEEISKNQLDKKVYQDIPLSHYGNQCRVLGFLMDETEQTFDGISNLDKESKHILLKQLCVELGVDITTKNSDGEDAVFSPDQYDDGEFPVRYIVNKDRLERYVENQFYAADPIRYKEVVVRQRATGNKQINRSYVKGMYTNQYGKIICQGCRRKLSDKEINAVEIANFGIEMEQLRLCLCPNCYQKYEVVKRTRSDEYKGSIKRAMENAIIGEKKPYYEIDMGSVSLFFTQTHLAEIQSILLLLDKYGVPIKEIEINVDKQTEIVGGQLDEIVVHDGEMIEYETMKDMKKHIVELDIDSYSLHKVMNGRPIGVVFDYNGEKYRITRKL